MNLLSWVFSSERLLTDDTTIDICIFVVGCFISLDYALSRGLACSDLSVVPGVHTIPYKGSCRYCDVFDVLYPRDMVNDLNLHRMIARGPLELRFDPTARPGSKRVWV